MKRRTFVQQSAFGAISLGVVSGNTAFNPFSFTPHDVTKWLRNMSWNLVLTRRSSSQLDPASFDQITTAKNEHFALLGFVRQEDHFYFFGDRDHFAFYPLVSTASFSGSHDFIMPVFRHLSKDQWQYVQTLSGYQVEAMMQASHALRKKGPSAVQNLVFPVGKNSGESTSGSYATNNGHVQVITKLKKGKAITTYSVFDPSGKIHEESFACSHLMA